MEGVCAYSEDRSSLLSALAKPSDTGAGREVSFVETQSHLLDFTKQLGPYTSLLSMLFSAYYSGVSILPEGTTGET